MSSFTGFYGHILQLADGGERVSLSLSDGYSVGRWLNGAKLIIGPR